MTATFFATDVDLVQVWRWLFTVPGMKIFEAYSIPDKPNRWFDTWEEILAYLDGGGHSLAAWPATVGGKPRMDRITFDTNTQRKIGAKGRAALLSPATIKVRRNNEQNGCLASASIGYWTEKGARQRSIYPVEFLDEIDWKQFRSIAGNIERLVAKSAPAKMRSYSVMPDAFTRYSNGEIMLWNWGEPCAYPSPLIVQNGERVGVLAP